MTRSRPPFVMAKITWREAFPQEFRGCVATIGNFDGVHRGHLALVRQLRRLADELGVPAVVVTFDPHPLAVLAPDRFEPLLTTPQQRAELLRVAGADRVLILRTEPSLLALSPEAFFTEILNARMQIRGLVEGPNFRFGHDRAGDVSLLGRLCAERGLPCVIVEPELLNGQMISSSKVRQALQGGDVSAARNWLGRPYRLEGVVVEGAGRGRRLGFPTANLADLATLVPRPGVYAAWAVVEGSGAEQNRPHIAAVHIGPNPTFAESVNKVEVHLLDHSENLLGKRLAVDFLQRIRDVQRFDSAEHLTRQIAEDLAAVRAAARTAEGPDGSLRVTPSLPAAAHDGVAERIVRVLEQEVRPGLKESGSDVEFVAFDRGVVSLRFSGACGSCPSTAFALLQEIERLLRERVPEVEYLETVA